MEIKEHIGLAVVEEQEEVQEVKAVLEEQELHGVAEVEVAVLELRAEVLYIGGNGSSVGGARWEWSNAR